MQNSTPTTRDQPGSAQSTHRWSVVDIVITAVLGFAVGLVFWAWAASWAVFQLWTNAYPPLIGLFGGVWVLAGPLAGLIIRRPGAALFCELIAATAEAVLGSHFGATVIISGLIQGLGAEAGFALLGYRRFGLGAALFSGALAVRGRDVVDTVRGARGRGLVAAGGMGSVVIVVIDPDRHRGPSGVFAGVGAGVEHLIDQ